MPNRKLSGAMIVTLAIVLGFSMTQIPSPFNSIIPFIAVAIFILIARILNW